MWLVTGEPVWDKYGLECDERAVMSYEAPGIGRRWPNQSSSQNRLKRAHKNAREIRARDLRVIFRSNNGLGDQFFATLERTFRTTRLWPGH